MEKPPHLRRIVVAVACTVLLLFLAGGAQAGSDRAADDACLGPRNVTAKAGPDGILVTWDRLDGALGYMVTRTDGGRNVTNVGPARTAFLDSNVEPRVTYSYEVRAWVDEPGQPNGASFTAACSSARATAVPVFPTMMAGGLALMWAAGAFLLMRRP